MNEGMPPEERFRSRRNPAQMAAGVVVIVAGIGLALLLVTMAVEKHNSRVNPGLQIATSAIRPEPRTARLVWAGSVANNRDVKLDAPWVRVTLYDPQGDSIDSGEAIIPASTIPAHGRRTYITTFDTRYSPDIRAVPTLELPNSRQLGM